MISSFVERIEEAYRRLGHQLGWRFLACPARMLAPQTRLAFVGLNPAGSRYESPQPSQEKGNAYRVEGWAPDGGWNALQVQVGRLYQEIAARSDAGVSARELMDATLAMNFCPFRSPEWRELPKRRESVAFSQGLWIDILDLADPDVVVCLGDVERHLKPVMERKGLRLVEAPTVKPVGWSNRTYSLSRYASERGETLIVRIPHLSHHKIFSRPQCRRAVDDFTTAIAQAATG